MPIERGAPQTTPFTREMLLQLDATQLAEFVQFVSPNEDFADLSAATETEDWGDLTAATEAIDWNAANPRTQTL